MMPRKTSSSEKGAAQAVKHYPQPKRHIGLSPGHLPERFGKPIQLQKCHKDIQPQRQRAAMIKTAIFLSDPSVLRAENEETASIA